jgi:hypothetical protein
MSKSGRVYSAYDKKYQATPEEVHKRVMRNKARREMLRIHGKAALKGKDVDHKKALSAGGSGAMSNLRIRSVHSNRADKSY